MKSMKEKIKILLFILISIGVIVFIAKELIYLNAYRECLKEFRPQINKWRCINILNGAPLP